MRTVATDVELKKSIEEFAMLLQKGIMLEALILFGSYVNGKPDEWSDFDIAVISPDFEDLLRWQRGHIIADLTLGRDTRISPMGYPSSEYHNPGRHSFLGEIIRTGVVVWQAEINQPSMS